jgi:hypothetical protein
MALDKVIDSTQLDNNLTAVAEAIRAKCGSSDKLEFPAGMVSAINQISSGVELNFEIIGGTSAPSGMTKENTIWVNTNTPVTGYIFSATEPEPPTDDSTPVWISTSASSTVAFSITKKNPIVVYPISAKQYISGTWTDVTAKSWQNGAWVDWWNGELYTPGNTYDGWMEVEMALNATNPQKGALTVTEGESSMKVTQNTANGGKAYVYSKKIDLTKYNTLEFVGTLYGLSGLTGAAASINVWRDLGVFQSDGLLASAHYTAPDKNIDVSAINEECYIGFFLWHTGSYADTTSLCLK